jgi:hypothetical protein
MKSAMSPGFRLLGESVISSVSLINRRTRCDSLRDQLRVGFGHRQVVYSQPQPPMYSQPYASSLNAGNVGGAIAGAVIGSRFGRGDGRLGATAIGTFLGSVIGGRMRE